MSDKPNILSTGGAIKTELSSGGADFMSEPQGGSGIVGDDSAYGELDVFGRSGQLSDEDIGEGKKKKRAPRDEEEYDDESDDDEEGDDSDDSEGEDESEEEASDDDEESENDESEDEEESDEESDDEDLSEKESKEVTKGYSLVTIDGQEVKIPDSTKLTIKVDGKKETLTFGRLKQIKSAETNYHRKHEELALTEKKVNKRVEVVERELRDQNQLHSTLAPFVIDLKESMLAGNFEDVLNDCCQMFGVNMEQFWNSYDAKLSKHYDEWNKLDPTVRQAKVTERNATLKEIALSKKEKQQTRVAENARVENAKSDLLKNIPGGFTKHEVTEAWEELNEGVRRGEIAPETADAIRKMDSLGKFRYALAYAVERRIDDKIDVGIERVSPKLKKKREKIAKLIRSTVKDENLLIASKKDMIDIIRSLTGIKGAGKSETRKGNSTTDSLRDKAQPRHKAGKPRNNEEVDDSFVRSDDSDYFGPRLRVY